MSRSQVKPYPQTRKFNVITSTKESFTSNQRVQVTHHQEIEKSFEANNNGPSLVPDFPAGFIHVELGFGNNLKANAQKSQQTKRNRRKKQLHNDPNSLMIQEIHQFKTNQSQQNQQFSTNGVNQFDKHSKNYVVTKAETNKPGHFTDIHGQNGQQKQIDENQSNLLAAERYAEYKKKRQESNALKSQKMQKKAVNKGLFVLPLSESTDLKVASKRPESSVAGQKEVGKFDSSNILFEQQATEVQAKKIEQRVEIAISQPRGGLMCQYNFKREKVNWRNFTNPEYELRSKQGQFLVSAKKQIGHLNSLYVISAEQKTFDRKGIPYIGYLQGNFTGSQFNLYQRKQNQDQLVATINYISQFSCAQTFRKMEIYLKNQAFSSLQMGERDKTLKELYELELNAASRSIVKLVSKVPVWNQRMDCYTLNFHGKSKYGSIKNTILVEQSSPRQELMIFCKTEDHQFHLEMKYPLTPFVAMGIVLTGFDFKLCCQ